MGERKGISVKIVSFNLLPVSFLTTERAEGPRKLNGFYGGGRRVDDNCLLEKQVLDILSSEGMALLRIVGNPLLGCSHCSNEITLRVREVLAHRKFRGASAWSRDLQENHLSSLAHWRGGSTPLFGKPS